ncbi:MAG: CPBP family intramembrane metalloprotease [Methylococcales bacterium]|nr:CPBP family intramembrane metalloprotease [Methylococcales bacterium]MDD5754163.1 CPBP family intramembrane metalloprotease [Methylococcales bacterium]
MGRSIFYVFVPFLVLLGITSSACVLSYVIALSFNDPTILRKLMIRLSQIMLLLSIFPVSKWLGLNKFMLGYAPFKIMVKQLGRGFGLSLLILLPVFFTLNGLGVHSVDMTKAWTLGWVAKKIGIAFGLALLIGIVEESVFRGLLLTSLRKYLPAFSAVLISAVYYAGLHFLDNKSPVSEETLSLSGSFQLLDEAYHNVFAMQDVTAFLALLTVGLFLGVLRWRGEMNLALCIGCHTGWVTQIRISKSMFSIDLTSPYSFLVSNYDGVIGLLVAGWLLFVLISYWLFTKVIKL